MNASSIALALVLNWGPEANTSAPPDSISVRLMLEDGTLAGGAHVSLYSEDTVTLMGGVVPFERRDRVADSATGAVRFERLRSGPYRLVARWEPKRERARSGQKPETAPDELPATPPVWWGFRGKLSPSPEESEIVLQPGTRQIVTVRTAEGAPVEKVGVRLVLKSSAWFTPEQGSMLQDVELGRSLKTRDGRFVLDGLIPGEWKYVFTAQDHGRTEVFCSRFPTESDLEVSIPRFITIAGEVHAPDGTPSADCWVGVEYEKTLSSVFEDGQVATRTDAAGKFVIKSARPGRATLKASFLVIPAGGLPREAAPIPRRLAELPLIVEAGKNLVDLRLELGEPK